MTQPNPGFANDVARDDSVGYRMRALSAGNVSYNGFKFPPALKSRVTVVPEYDEAGRTMKYMTIAISIEFITTDPTVPPSDVDGDTTYKGRMDNMMGSLYATLSQPCQPLHLELIGLGNISVNDLSAGADNKEDIDYGPKPQVIEIEPLGGGLASRVEWLCTTRIAPCFGNAIGELTEFTYSVGWSFDPAGFMIRKVEGIIGLPATRNPQVESLVAGGSISIDPKSVEAANQLLTTNFPLLSKFRRQTFYRITPDRRRIQFTVEDTEIRSDSLYPPGISKIHIHQSVGSALKSGFLVWAMNISGNLEIANGRKEYIQGPIFNQGVTTGDRSGTSVGYSKLLAWFWLGVILRDRLNLQRNLQGTPTSIYPVSVDSIKSKRKSGYEVVKGIKETSKSRRFILPTNIQVTDSLYSNQIQFTFSYRIHDVEPSNILKAVGVLTPVSIAGLKKDTWVKYLDYAGTYGINPSVPTKTDIVVDLCHPINSGSSYVPEEKKPNKIGSSLMSPQEDLEGTWPIHTNKFKFHILYPTTKATKLLDIGNVDEMKKYAQETQVLPSDHDSPINNDIDGVLGGIDPDSLYKMDQMDHELISTTPVEVYVIMYGRAERYGPINSPILIDVGGVPATRIDDSPFGMSMEIPSQKDTGMLYKDGTRAVLHKLTWKLIYMLDSAPASFVTNTTGDPHRINKPRN